MSKNGGGGSVSSIHAVVLGCGEKKPTTAEKNFD